MANVKKKKACLYCKCDCPNYFTAYVNKLMYHCYWCGKDTSDLQLHYTKIVPNDIWFLDKSDPVLLTNISA